MALQSQTYANSGSGYYIQSGVPNNPSTITALNGPVEILFTSSIKGDFYGELNQTPNTFTISENKTATLSTINFLTMDPINEVTQMGINDILNPLGEPVIQQWTRTDSIVNGRFKVGNKQLGDEPNALNIYNNIQKTTLQQNTVIQTMDGTNERFRFTNLGFDPFLYTEIGASFDNTGTIKCASDGFSGVYANTTMEPTKIIFNNGALQGNATLGVNDIAPYQYYTSSKNAIEFVVDDIGAVITPLSLNKDGTVTMVSTLNVPTLQQGNIIQTIDGANTRNRFANVADSATAYVEINQIPTAPSLIVLNAEAQIKITPSTIAVSNFSAVPSQVAKIGTIPSFPNTFMIESYADTQIRTSMGSLSTATFKADGTVEFLSTLLVPYISTTIASMLALTNVSSINGRDINTFTEPTGMMVPYTPFAPSAPVGYLLCDGTAYPTGSYPALYTLIGTTYGSGIAGTFRVPDMRGRGAFGSVTTNQNGGSRVITANALGVSAPFPVPTGVGIGTTSALIIDSADGNLIPGMRCITAGYEGRITNTASPTMNQIVLFISYTTLPTVFPATLQFVFEFNADTYAVPSISNGVTGGGRDTIFMKDFEVPPHYHTGRNGGSQVSAPGNTRTEPSGGDTGNNNNLWSYTDPVTLTPVVASSGINNFPPNMGTWFIIKY